MFKPLIQLKTEINFSVFCELVRFRHLAGTQNTFTIGNSGLVEFLVKYPTFGSLGCASHIKFRTCRFQLNNRPLILKFCRGFELLADVFIVSDN